MDAAIGMARKPVHTQYHIDIVSSTTKRANLSELALVLFVKSFHLYEKGINPRGRGRSELTIRREDGKKLVQTLDEV